MKEFTQERIDKLRTSNVAVWEMVEAERSVLRAVSMVMEHTGVIAYTPQAFIDRFGLYAFQIVSIFEEKME